MGFNGVGWAADFVHLHVASAYSLRYGVASPAALVARAVQHGMGALALTDRDGLYGAVKHAVACAEAGIATILGADLALAGDTVDPMLNSQAPPPLRSEDAAPGTPLASGPPGGASLCRLGTPGPPTGGPPGPPLYPP